jgi:hypothetical protein
MDLVPKNKEYVFDKPAPSNKDMDGFNVQNSTTATRFIRGPRLAVPLDVSYQMHQRKGKHDYGIFWGGVLLPSSTEGHYMAVGRPRSGKTILIRLLLQSVLPLIGNPYKVRLDDLKKNPKPRQGEGHRAIIWDAKNEYFTIIHSLPLNAKVHNMNFLDERGRGWDIAKDIRTPSEASEFATILTPQPKEGDRRQGNSNFFEDAARTMAVIVLEALQQEWGLTWTLMDFVHYMGNRADLEELLTKYPSLQERLTNLARRGDTSADIGSQVETIIAPLRLAANLSRFSKEPPISFKEWITEESILIFPAVQRKVATLTPVYRLMLDYLFKELLSMKDPERGSFAQRTWVFLDEVPQIKGISNLSTLMGMGASKNVSVVIGFQTLSMMRDAFGDNESKSVIDLCSFRVFLNIEGSETAEFAAKQIGTIEVYEEEHGVSRNQGSVNTKTWQTGTSTSVNRSHSDSTQSNYQSSMTHGSSHPSLLSIPSGHWTDSQSSTYGSSHGDSHSNSFGETAGTSSSQGGSRAQSEGVGASSTVRRVARDVFLPSQFMHYLQVADSEKGLSAICVSPYTGVYPLWLGGDMLFMGTKHYPPALLPLNPEVITEMPRDEMLIYQEPFVPRTRASKGTNKQAISPSQPGRVSKSTTKSVSAKSSASTKSGASAPTEPNVHAEEQDTRSIVPEPTLKPEALKLEGFARKPRRTY